jgi:hypothetical protein
MGMPTACTAAEHHGTHPIPPHQPAWRHLTCLPCLVFSWKKILDLGTVFFLFYLIITI